MKLLKHSLFLSLLLVLIGCGQNEPQKERTLIVGISADYPPFAYYQKEKIVGFEVDLARMIADHLGYDTIQFEDMDFSGLIPSLKSGRIDMIISGLTVTPEREKNVDFSQSYYSIRPALIIRKNALNTPTTHYSFAGKKIGVQLGSTLETLAFEISTHTPNVQVISISKTLQLIEELKLHRIDAILLEEQQAKAFIKANESLDHIILKDQPLAQWAIALPKKSPLQEPINNAITSLQQKGQIDALLNLWESRLEEDTLSQLED